LLPDLNFRPNGEQALKEFVDEKSPKNDLEVALATVYYMQHVMALPKIGPAHLMTAFKEAGKPIPSDVRQTIRNVKKSKIWLNFNDIEDVRTTTQGDNFVEHQMGKGE
jgi:ribosomal protein L1